MTGATGAVTSTKVTVVGTTVNEVVAPIVATPAVLSVSDVRVETTCPLVSVTVVAVTAPLSVVITTLTPAVVLIFPNWSFS